MITELILKYLNNEASEKEITSIFKWIEASEENKAKFIELKKAWVLTASNNTQKAISWKTIKKQTIKRRRYSLLKYAAILIIVFGIGQAIYLNQKPNTPVINEVVLELSDGTTKSLNKTQEEIIVDSNGNIIGKQESNEIIYQTRNSNKEIAYNTLKTPYGKTFKLTLSDGTIVHLNSGTVFKFPEQFVESKNREVYLTGEAFFEVAKNPEQPFIVHSNSINIEVLGTVFNVSAYDDDFTTHCELVEGSVRLSETGNYNNNTLLSPNQKFTWNKNTKSFEKQEVDVKTYTAWVYGELIFKNEPFEILSKKLERTYGIKIINNNNYLASQRFTGTINIKESSIESIFDLLKLDTPFNYSKNENTIKISNSNY
jgi:transmembrane sensor